MESNAIPQCQQTGGRRGACTAFRNITRTGFFSQAALLLLVSQSRSRLAITPLARNLPAPGWLEPLPKTVSKS